MLSYLIKLVRLFFLVVFLWFTYSNNAVFALEIDENDCFTCHKYPNLEYYDVDGTKRNFYIIQDVYLFTFHGFSDCRDCHNDVKELPHGMKNIKEVDCSIECHNVKIETAEGKEELYSHKKSADEFDKSVHSPKTLTADGKSKDYIEELPKCKTCHLNSFKSEREGDLKLIRMELVEGCKICHADEEFNKRRETKKVDELNDVFHVKAIEENKENTPDCISCHSPDGYPAHIDKRFTDKASPVSFENWKDTCNQADCHKGDIMNGLEKKKVHDITAAKEPEMVKKETKKSKGIAGFFKNLINKVFPEKIDKDKIQEIREVEDIKVIEEFRGKQKKMRERFHSVEDVMKKPHFCLTCHSDSPHSKSLELNPHFNMHIDFIACEVCHIRKKEGDELYFSWFDNTTGEKVYRLLGKPGRYNAKIVPVKKELDGSETRLDQIINEEFARDFIDNGHNWTLEKKAKAKAIIHEDLREKPVLCDECHKVEGYINFQDMNYDEERVRQLETGKIVDIAEIYVRLFKLSTYNPDWVEKKKVVNDNDKGIKK